MKICICTIVKDEQEYIEDWIKYHKNLGIDKIYIFEDFNSSSHKDILKNYSDKVELLDSSSFCLSEKKKQSELQRRLLDYIKSLNLYDWCFVIDIDEYLTLENENDNIKDILSLFSNYGEVVVYWKNYGANDHIYKPDYSKVDSYREYYTKECGFSNYDYNHRCFTKKIVNLKLMHDKYVFNQHFPSRKCRATSTDFYNQKYQIFDRIYIKHYITKSWEEYVHKLFVRGMHCPEHRKIDDFFEMNSELNEKREELENMIPDIINKYDMC